MICCSGCAVLARGLVEVAVVAPRVVVFEVALTGLALHGHSCPVDLHDGVAQPEQVVYVEFFIGVMLVVIATTEVQALGDQVGEVRAVGENATVARSVVQALLVQR